MLKSVNNNTFLTENNYCNLLELLLFIEEHQMSIDIRDYDREVNDLIPSKRMKSNFFEMNVSI